MCGENVLEVVNNWYGTKGRRCRLLWGVKCGECAYIGLFGGIFNTLLSCHTCTITSMTLFHIKFFLKKRNMLEKLLSQNLET